MKEELILRALRRRDPKGLEAAMGRYSAYVSAVVWNILRDSMTVSDAEEVVSDVFLALWDQAVQVEKGKLKSWLAAVARNQARHKLRQRGKDLPLEADALDLTEDDPEDALLEQAQSRALRTAVENMGEPDREIFLRHYYYIQPLAEISRDMGIKESTVKSRLKRGREKLKDAMREWSAQ